MTDTILTECNDFTRESREYWEKRLKDNWEKPYHGMYFDNPDLIAKMDGKNLLRLTFVIQELKARGIKDISILEAGCGNGRYVPILSDLVKSYTAFDFAQSNVDEALALYPNTTAKIFRCDMSEASEVLKGQKFHIIFMVATLTSIQRNFFPIMKKLKTLLHENCSIFVFEQDMVIEFFGHWKGDY